MNIFLLGLMIFLTSIIKFAINFKFFLSSLICLEFLVLLLFFMQNQLMNLILFEKLFLMIFLTFSVCEGVLGICLLIMMIRYYGNNFFQSLSCMLC